MDSIYNGLPGRGVSIRIWPGRYPTVKEEENYGDFLAPSIRKAMESDPTLRSGGGMTGDRGKPTDNIILGEDVLVAKEINQGAAYFQLQHMLDTRLADAERYPLKTDKIIFTSLSDEGAAISYQRQLVPANRLYTPQDYPVKAPFYRAGSTSVEFGSFEGTHMYVDPAGGGQNGDETAYAVTQFMAGKVFVRAVGGVPGGLGEDSLHALTAIAEKWQPETISIEENYGKGALSHIWQPILLKKVIAEIEDVWESGQKELRIIDVLEPMIGAGRLVMDEEIIQKDWDGVKKYPVEKQTSYMLFHQMSRITRDRDSLIHDDRLDALAGSCRHWSERLVEDEAHAAAANQQKRYDEMMANPLGNGRKIKTLDPRGSHNLSKFQRRW